MGTNALGSKSPTRAFPLYAWYMPLVQ
jgi:hypothetical protein